MENSVLVLFDGNAVVHRAYHAFENTRPLTVRKTGEIVSAVYGFALMLLKVINDLNPAWWAVAFDKKAPTFRHEMYEAYKAHRVETPGELVAQFDRVKELVRAFNIPIFEIDGFEADDVLGTLSSQASEKSVDTVVVTGDADAMQLVNPRVKVLYPKPRKSFGDTTLFDELLVEEKYGVAPVYITDLKALKGDASDNIPGVPGIGEKTAVKLIQQFGNVDQIYEHLEEVKPERTRKLLEENREKAYQSKTLATIVTDVPVTLDMEECHVSQYNRETVAQLFRELEFYSLLAKLPGGVTEEKPQLEFDFTSQKPDGDYHTVTTSEQLQSLAKRLKQSGSFAFDTETDSLDVMNANLVGISVSPQKGEAYYIPVGHIGLQVTSQLPLAEVTDALKPVFADETIPKTAHNAKYDMHILTGSGIPVNGLSYDTMIAAHLLNEKSLGLKNLSFARLSTEMTEITELIGSGSKQCSMAVVDIEQASPYACADADMTYRLAELFKPELEEKNLWKLFTEVEMPLVPVLMAMERNGVLLDTVILDEMSGDLAAQLSQLEKSIYNTVGYTFNINSTQQLGTALFEKLGLPAPKKTRGNHSTSAVVLEGLRGENPVIDTILEYRQLTKLKSTYIDAFTNLINKRTGRVHTSFNQTKTVTGRLSSSDPNLQNIPVRTEIGRKVRQAFIAPEGSILLAADYSQIDLRALAHLSQDEALLTAFKRDEDIHSSTAALIYGVSPEEVTSAMRRFAKTVNFGVIYGMSDYGLEQATELSRKEASEFIKAYFEKYPGVVKYLEDTKEQARSQGFVQTLLGRRRYIPEIVSANRQIRESAERMAINMPVQGTSADIIKVAMIQLCHELKERNLQSKMLLQVHDELIFEVPENELEEMHSLVPAMMVGALELSVPLKVDTKTGRNWGGME